MQEVCKPEIAGGCTYYGGQITVQSAEGQGTTCTITLPRAATEAPTEPVLPN